MLGIFTTLLTIIPAFNLKRATDFLRKLGFKKKPTRFYLAVHAHVDKLDGTEIEQK